ncbi:MAG: hypothetical protein HGA19_16830 [Oscillochloris sp.]|nr:hypothetical protein [Oscillochloris sp.]
MTISQTPVPPAPLTGPLSTVTNVGISLVRLCATVITLPITTASTLTSSLANVVTNVATTATNAVNSQGSNEIVSAATNVINSTTGLYVTLLKTAVSGLDTVARTVNTTVNDVAEKVRT